jgi:hypothetical protein
MLNTICAACSKGHATSLAQTKRYIWGAQCCSQAVNNLVHLYNIDKQSVMAHRAEQRLEVVWQL